MKVGDYVKVKLYPGAKGFIVPRPPTVRHTTRPDAIYVLLTKVADGQYANKTFAFRPSHIEVISEGG